jgi:hypothetical protein
LPVIGLVFCSVIALPFDWMLVKFVPGVAVPASLIPPPNTSRFEFAGATVPLSNSEVALPLVL